MFNTMTKSSGKTYKALCHAVKILVFVTFFKDMNVPFDGIAYLIVFNIEGVASLHFHVLFYNQCYSGLSCRIFNTPAWVNRFCTNVCLGAFAGSWFVDHGEHYQNLTVLAKMVYTKPLFQKGFARKRVFKQGFHRIHVGEEGNRNITYNLPIDVFLTASRIFVSLMVKFV
jgi:hypothetical protein